MKKKAFITALFLTVFTSTSSADNQNELKVTSQDSVLVSHSLLLTATSSNQTAAKNPCLTWPVCKDS